MITVVIKDSPEKNVIDLTYENIEKELRDIKDAQIIIHDNWVEAVGAARTDYICFVESDCVVNSGYFTSLVGILSKDEAFRKMGILSSATGVVHWGDRIYGYAFNEANQEMISPLKSAGSEGINPVQFAYIPGSIIRTKMLRRVLDRYEVDWLKVKKDHTRVNKLDEGNLVDFSVTLSSMFWALGPGHRVAINPNTTYVSTENHIDDSINVLFDPTELKLNFKKAGIL